MTRLRKQRRRKKYRYNTNRKRLRDKVLSTGKIACKEIKQAWDQRKSLHTNYKEMGLSSDPNHSIPISASSQILKLSSHSNSSGKWKETNIENELDIPKKHVVEALEQDARAPRAKLFRLPKSQVEWITYLMDKYGTDYKAMARDRKNYNQETWKQLRAKIRRFKSIPEQYSKYLEEKGLTADCFEEDETILGSDSE